MSILSSINLLPISTQQRNFVIKPDIIQCKSLATILNVDNLQDCSLELLIQKKHNNVFCLSGLMKTKVEQRCSVSNEVIITAVHIKVIRNYKVEIAGRSHKKLEISSNEKIVEFDISTNLDDEIEILDTHNLSLDSLFTEILSLEINPYIKKPQYMV